MVYLAALIGLIVGVVCGYVLRREVVETTADDSDRRLKELRQLHASCGDRIRGMSLQIAQLQSEMAERDEPAKDHPTYELAEDMAHAGSVEPTDASHEEATDDRGNLESHEGQDVIIDLEAIEEQVTVGDAAEDQVEVGDDTVEGTPLTVIPGIGTISASRLEAAGLGSVEELAALEPAAMKALVDDLGRLGQRMLREDWVSAARTELEHRTTSMS